LAGPDDAACAALGPDELGRDPLDPLDPDDVRVPVLVGDGEGDGDGVSFFGVMRSANDSTSPPDTGVGCAVVVSPRAHAPVARVRTRTAATFAAGYTRPLIARLTSWEA
jgi:hypothetical protein